MRELASVFFLEDTYITRADQVSYWPKDEVQRTRYSIRQNDDRDVEFLDKSGQIVCVVPWSSCRNVWPKAAPVAVKK